MQRRRYARCRVLESIPMSRLDKQLTTCRLERPLRAAVNHTASMMPTDAQTSARKCNIDVMQGVVC
eukprot:205845-Amphidinium_carterae.1